jgi:lipoic acid synthetase
VFGGVTGRSIRRWIRISHGLPRPAITACEPAPAVDAGPPRLYGLGMEGEAAQKPKKPDWLRVRLPGGERYNALKQTFRTLDLNTVCEEARCPNVGECWGEGTATIMILGETCTRGCRFCAVNTGDPGGVTDPREPENTALALARLDLAYVVLTMVDRDDLLDGGAAHVALTVRRIKHHSPKLLVETLVGDFAGRRQDVETLVREGQPDVFAHNVEVVPGLQRKMRDARCSWERSVEVLRWAKDDGAQVTKSSLMVGCGEGHEEVLEAMERLREAGVDVLTIGQYLRPTPKHAEVVRYVEPAEFDLFRERGLSMGFKYVASGPLVRSSYRAAEVFLRGILGGEPGAASRLGGDPFEDRYGKKARLPVLR